MNRYGDPTASVNLYNYGEATNLTLGQLVSAICCRAGMALEAQSVSQVNTMTLHSRRLQALAKILQTLTDGAEKGYDTKFDLEGFGSVTAREFLEKQMGYTFEKRKANGEVSEAGQLPAAVKDPNDRFALYAALKEKLDAMTTESQRRMIDLQSSISRRDVAYATASNTVQTLGGVLQTTASNF